MTGRQQETSDSVCHRKLTDRLSKSLADDTHPLRTEFDSRLIDRSGRLKYPSQKQHALSSHSFREPYRHSTSHMTGTYCLWPSADSLSHPFCWQYALAYCLWPSADSLSRPFCWQYALTVCDHQQTHSPVLSADSMHLLSTCAWEGVVQVGGRKYVNYVIQILTTWSGDACLYCYALLVQYVLKS